MFGEVLDLQRQVDVQVFGLVEHQAERPDTAVHTPASSGRRPPSAVSEGASQLGVGRVYGELFNQSAPSPASPTTKESVRVAIYLYGGHF